MAVGKARGLGGAIVYRRLDGQKGKTGLRLLNRRFAINTSLLADTEAICKKKLQKKNKLIQCSLAGVGIGRCNLRLTSILEN
jgi:protein involved in sex pheromone biosynthesis